MNFVYKGARMLKDMYNQLNPATLTGAIDILVIEQEDKEMCASPFHVRFGKLGVLRAKEKLVNITINDEVVDLHMKLGDQGEAFFVVETDDEEIPAGLLTSPFPSRPVSPMNDGPAEANRSLSREDSTVKRKRRKRRKRRSFSSQSNDLGVEYSQSSDSEDDVIAQVNPNLSSIEQNSSQKPIHPPEPQLSLDIEDDEYDAGAGAPYTRLCSVFSDSELPQREDHDTAAAPSNHFSDSEAMERIKMTTPLGWDWGELPNKREPKDQRQNVMMPKLGKSKLTIENEQERNLPHESSNVSESDEPETIPEPVSEPEPETSPSLTLLSTPTKNDSDESVQPTSSRENSPKKKARHPTEGLYLDEILGLEPSEADLYLSTKQQDIVLDMQDPDACAIDDVGIVTPDGVFADAGVDSGTDCLISDDAGGSIELNVSPSVMSLCGGKMEAGKLVVDEEKFRENLVTYEQFMDDPFSITNNSDLVIRLGDQYCNWEIAGPLFLSVCIFKKPLSNEIVERVINKQMSKKSRAAAGGRLAWFWRGGSQRDSTSSSHSDQGVSNAKEKEETDAAIAPTKIAFIKSFSAAPALQNASHTDESSSCDDEITSFATDRKELKRAQTVQAFYHHPQPRAMRKSTRLTSDQLKSLNLKPGANKVSFSVTSQYQGTSRCYATIYLWQWTDRLVVSDIDGTITKSDVFGQILPVVGKDWTQGGVAQLFDNISKNGYKFIYLSARAIGQAGMTKGYLNWINQQGVSLPAGPLFLSPTSLIRAFRTEVIEKKPEKFKIQCLEDIKALFPPHSQPLIAGFGNKINDVVAYTAVGIPRRRVFTINPKGELKQEDVQMYTTSYGQLGDVVDTFFPALDSEQCTSFSDTQEYSAFNYWRTDMPNIVNDLTL